MAKRITQFSKLTKEKRAYIKDLIEDRDISIVEVNSKKGVILDLDGEEYLVMLDYMNSNNSPKTYSKDDDDDEDDDDDDDIDEVELEGEDVDAENDEDEDEVKDDDVDDVDDDDDDELDENI